MAGEMGLTEGETREIELAALLHDLGRIAVPESAIQKQDDLTEEESRLLARAPAAAAEILAAAEPLRPASPLVRHVYERWDGQGYPDRLAGDKIPLGSRLVAVAATFEAMTSDRPYRRRLPEDVAVKEIKSCAGVQFDPLCVEAFLRLFRKGKLKELLK
jgi:response regulator RpfG family c-di-GMP phosphodiesterase